jgi:uncharacterized membrane protein
MVAAAVLGIALMLAVVEMGELALDRSRAQTAADAAALASFQGGQRAAQRLAAVHGGTLVSWEFVDGGADGVERCPDHCGEVLVEVRVGEVSATARASNMP